MLKLRNNGVTLQSTTYLSKWVSQFTTSSTSTNSSNLMVKYLMSSLGFTKKEALATSTEVSGPTLKSTENAISVVGFLQTSGFNKTQIKSIVSCTPKILSCSVDKNMKPKIQAFQDVGLSGPDIAHIISGYPHIFWRDLDGHIIPTIQILKSTFGDNDVIGDGNGDGVGGPFFVKALKKSCWMLSPSIRKVLPLTVGLLQSYGLSLDQIKVLVIRKPRFMALSSRWVEAILVKVEEEFGIPRGSRMFLHGICALSSLSEEKLKLKTELYKSYGFSEADLVALVRSYPYALAMSESKLRKSLDFFTKDLGLSPGRIAQVANQLNLSLEKRIYPRHVVVKVLKEKGLMKIPSSFSSCLNLTESQFFERYVQPFKEIVPVLYEGYMKSVHSTSTAVK